MPTATFFETARLRARAFSPADLTAFVTYRADPDVARYQSWSDYTPELGAALIESMQHTRPGRPGEWYQLALEDQVTGRLVGDLALQRKTNDPRVAEVGFTLAPDQQGNGFATEALTALLTFAFATFDLHRVIAVTDALNTPAAALLARVGLRREAHFVENVFFKGSWGSELLFAVLEREWTSRATPPA